MNVRRLSRIVLFALAIVSSPAAQAQEKLYVYTSMKESLVSELKKAFKARHPEVKLDYQSAGAGKLMAKIAAERESGRLLADIIWTSEVPDFFQLKAEGMLHPYVPKEIATTTGRSRPYGWGRSELPTTRAW
jgi:iron(III) transport system substrate-binding protein